MAWRSRICSITDTVAGPNERARSVNQRRDHSPSMPWCWGGTCSCSAGVLALAAHAPRVLTHQVVPVEDRHPSRGQPHPPKPPGQPVGHRVPLVVTTDVVVACGLDLFPCHLLEPRGRQRRQQWLFLGAKLLPAGGAISAAQVVVDLPDTLLDGVVQLLKRRP